MDVLWFDCNLEDDMDVGVAGAGTNPYPGYLIIYVYKTK